MRRAVKRSGMIVRAYRLGSGAPALKELEAAGRLRRCGDGCWEVFSREARDGTGELAREGDYVKLDAGGIPYPNKEDYFLACHRALGEDRYEQIPRQVLVWKAGDPMCPEIEFLIREKGLVLNEQSLEAFFRAPLWGSILTGRRDSALVLYSVRRDEDGRILDADFNFVAADEYQRGYIEQIS